MDKGILQVYRRFLKQAYKIKPRDTYLFKSMMACIQSRKMSTSLKQSLEILPRLTKLIQLGLTPDNKRQITKLIRIFSNSSYFITPNMQFRSDSMTLAMQKLSTDTQYIFLSDKDKQFVKNVIKRVCDKKPVMKFHSIIDYLDNNNSEKFQIEQSKQQHIVRQTKDQVEEQESWKKSEWYWVYKGIKGSKQNLMDQVVEEIMDKKIIIC